MLSPGIIRHPQTHLTLLGWRARLVFVSVDESILTRFTSVEWNWGNENRIILFPVPSRQRTALLAFDRKIYFQFLKRLVSIWKLLLSLIFSFVKKDALSGILVPATVGTHISFTSRRMCILIWDLGGFKLQMFCTITVWLTVAFLQSAVLLPIDWAGQNRPAHLLWGSHVQPRMNLWNCSSPLNILESVCWHFVNVYSAWPHNVGVRACKLLRLSILETDTLLNSYWIHFRKALPMFSSYRWLFIECIWRTHCPCSVWHYLGNKPAPTHLS